MTDEERKKRIEVFRHDYKRVACTIKKLLEYMDKLFVDTLGLIEWEE